MGRSALPALVAGGRTRRRIAAAGALAGGAALVSACIEAPAPALTAQSGAPKRSSRYTVRLQVWGDVGDRDVYERIRADFNAAHTDIAVENDYQAETISGAAEGGAGSGYFERLVTNLAAGTAADLAYFQGWTWQEYAGRGALQPLDEMAARDKWATPWPAEEAYDLQTTFRGKRYLSPSNTATAVMYYAKEYFDKAGIPYPKDGWTYTEFQDLCRRLTRLVDGQPAYAYQWNGGYRLNAPWWRMNNHREWDRIAEPRKAAWNAGAVIEAYQYQLYDSQYKLGISPTQRLMAASPRDYRVEYGRVAMKVDGPSFLDRMWGPQAGRAGGTAFDVQLLPRGKASRPQHMNAIGGQAMTRQSKDREAAWEVLKWIGGEPGQQRIAEGGRMCNVAEACRRWWLPLAKQRYNVANAEAFVKAIEGASIDLVAEVTESVLNHDAGLSAALDAIRDGDATPRQALDAVQPKIQHVLDSYWAAQSSGR
jgi:multiple sugar transport system substrate-binding protein